jgi:DnaJ-domain-containing protein 1
MEGEALTTIKTLTKNLFLREKEKKEERKRLEALPLARHLFNILLEYHIKEKEDQISRLRREGREGKSLALGTALAFFGLDPTASPEELSKARKKLLQKSHPDLAGDKPGEAERKEELSRRINQTYEYILERMGVS